jgi:hypothetical protein
MIDISSWLTIYDKELFCQWLVEEGIEVVVLRLGNGATKDKKFDEWHEMLETYAPEIRIGAYYWPNELDYAQTSFNYIKAFLGDKYLDFLAVDIESPYYSGNWALLKSHMFALDDMLKQNVDPKRIYVYTSSRATGNMGADTRYKTLFVWNAVWYSTYDGEFPSGDTVPWRIPTYITEDQVHIWQFYNKWVKGNAPHSSNGIDCNVTYQELEPVFDDVEEPDPPPPDEDGFTYSYKVLVNSLNVRSGPGTEFTPINYLYLGQQGWVSRFALDNRTWMWAEIAPNAWACVHSSVDYMQIFENELVEPVDPPDDPDPPVDPPVDPDPPDEPPDYTGEMEVRGVSDSKPWSVAWGSAGQAPSGREMIEVNCFAYSKDDRYKFPKGTKLVVYKDVEVAEGGERYHEIYGLTYIGEPVYLRKSEAMKLW